MSNILIFIIMVFTFFIVSCEESEDKEIIIKNPVLRLCIINELRKDKDDVIYKSEAESLKYIRCAEKGIYNVKGIENFINLEYLELSGTNASGEFIEIAKLKNLKEFYLYHYSKPYSFLSSLKKLEVLSLFPTYTGDLSALENTNIKSLEIFYSWNKAPISALNSIGKIISLEKLYLDVNKISNLKFLTNLTNLKFLKIDYNELKDLTPLENLVNLEELNLIGNNDIEDLSPLKDLTKLRVIAVTDTEIKDLNALENLVNLEILHAYHNLKLKDISGLKNLTKLYELKLSECDITDISSLSNLTKLNYLTLGGNENLSDPLPLSNLINLEALGVHYTKIRTFNFLKNLAKLEEVGFSNNGIVNINTIEDAIYLKRLDLNYNYITDLSPLINLNLDIVDVGSNCITDFSFIEHIPNIIGENHQRTKCDILED